MADTLTDLVRDSAWTYAIVLGLVAADAVLPLVPGETVVIAAAILAADGHLSIEPVLAAAFAGSFAGDNASWALGRGVGGGAARRLTRGARATRMLAWARERLEGHGRWMLMPARFVPGGRTATTFTAGAVGMPWREFAPVDAVAAGSWSLYITALGYVGGTTFRDSSWKALVLSLLVAVLVSVGGELARRRSARRA
jgi:membrane protein DedA with SNARE-associated domain